MYQPGTVINGHVLGHDGVWHPLAAPQKTGFWDSLGEAAFSPLMWMFVGIPLIGVILGGLLIGGIVLFDEQLARWVVDVGNNRP